MSFAIYYADGLVSKGSTRKAWRKAPDEGVQVVVLTGKLMQPRLPGSDHRKDGYCFTGDRTRQFFTGVDEYDPLGWGVKYGSLLETPRYTEIWDRAVNGDD